MWSSKNRPHPSPLAMSKLSNGLSFSSRPGFYKLPNRGMSQPSLQLTPLTTRHNRAYTTNSDGTHNRFEVYDSTTHSVNDEITDFDTALSNNNSMSSVSLPSGEICSAPNQALHNSIYQSLIPTLAPGQPERRPLHRSRTSRQPNKLLSSASSLRSTVSTILSLRSSNHKKQKLNLLDFPLEILDDILGNLDQTALLNLITVSKVVSSLAIRHLYFEPQFVSTYRFAQFVTTVSTNEEIASYVKIFDLSSIPADLVKPGTDQPIAGWRDWKLRTEPLYSVNSSTHSLHTFQSLPGRVVNPIDSMKPKTQRQRSKSEVVRPNTTSSPASSKTRSVLMRYSKFTSSFSSSNKNATHGNNVGSTDYSQPKSSRKRRRALSLTSYGGSRATDNLKPVKSQVVDLRQQSILQQEQKVQKNGFLTSHPTQSVLLRQYSNSKDIPVGALLHILECCKNILIVDLSNVQFADDYYVTEHKLYPATSNSGLIFVSDVARLHFWPDEHIRTATGEDVIKSVSRLQMLRAVNIKNVTWLTKSQVAQMVGSLASIEGDRVECDFSDSGLARGLDWAAKGNIEELRKRVEVS